MCVNYSSHDRSSDVYSCFPKAATPWRCWIDGCKRLFSTKQLRILHQEQFHVKLKTKICDICGRQFKSNSELTTHRRKHTGEKPFKVIIKLTRC